MAWNVTGNTLKKYNFWHAKYGKTHLAVNSEESLLLEWEGERRMQKRCVAEKRRQMCFQGREVWTRRGSQEFLHAPPPPPLSHLPPCGIFLHEWLCHTWGTKWSLSLFLCLSLTQFLPTSPLVSLCCDYGEPSLVSCVVLCRKRTWGLKE